MIKLNKTIYLKKSVEQSIIDFKDIIDVKIAEDDSNYLLNLNFKEQIPDLDKEFVNYCYGLSQNERNFK